MSSGEERTKDDSTSNILSEKSDQTMVCPALGDEVKRSISLKLYSLCNFTVSICDEINDILTAALCETWAGDL